MSKAVMISIQPKWCELIASGKKTIEVRKTKPKLATPFKCYIYESGGDQRVGNENFNCYLKGKGRKKIIGEFVCDRIRTEREVADGLVDIVLEMQSCVDCKELIEYADGKKLYSWNISDLVIYDEPKELDEFRKPIECHRGIARENCIGCWDCEITIPPQSWCYVWRRWENEQRTGTQQAD